MTRILAAGTFDHLHKGHKHYLEMASKLGDELYVVVARDSNVIKIKNIEPTHNQEERKKAVENLPYVTEAIIGNKGDLYKIIEELKPDIIAMGYDQAPGKAVLEKELKSRGLTAKIIRFSDDQALEPTKFKSSVLRKSEKQHHNL